MTKRILFFCCLFLGLTVSAQLKSKEFRSKKFEVVKDTILIDSVNINSQKFKVLNADKKVISSSEYQIDFTKPQLIINSKKYKSITIEYFIFPEFITKVYKKFDEKIIVPDTKNTQKLYSLTTNKNAKRTVFFNEL